LLNDTTSEGERSAAMVAASAGPMAPRALNALLRLFTSTRLQATP